MRERFEEKKFSFMKEDNENVEQVGNKMYITV